jgi:ParB-like chromosome segregation protein Spo0J
LPLTPLEKASVVKRLQTFGWTSTEIAKRMGVSLVAVLDLIKLLEAPAEIKEAVANNIISATLATDAVKAGTTKELKTAVDTAKAENRIRVTQKDVETKPKSGIQLYVRKVKGKMDLFEEDSDGEFLFPCSGYSNRKDLETCKTCVHDSSEE